MANQIVTQNLREEKGLQIANAKNEIHRIEENFYAVQSQSGNGKYAVLMVDNEWICECPR
jgi:hypothetical protein